MYNVLQEYIPGHIGRYNDDFEPRAFGDNIQKWGTSTILIESGGFLGDTEKQFIRRLNFIAVLSAINTIADEKYKTLDIKKYKEIPNNDQKLFDLKLKGLTYPLFGSGYILDLGINNNEIDIANDNYYYSSTIEDQGDLSTYYGYLEVDMSGYEYKRAKIYPKIIENLNVLRSLDFEKLLKSGIGYVKVKNLPDNQKSIPYPVQVIGTTFKIPEVLVPGRNTTFFLTKDNQIRYAVINGFLIDIVSGFSSFKNALILK